MTAMQPQCIPTPTPRGQRQHQGPRPRGAESEAPPWACAPVTHRLGGRGPGCVPRTLCLREFRESVGCCRDANRRAPAGPVRAGSAGQGFTLPVPTRGQRSRGECRRQTSPSCVRRLGEPCAPIRSPQSSPPTSVRGACPGLTATLLPRRGWEPAPSGDREPLALPDAWCLQLRNKAVR